MASSGKCFLGAALALMSAAMPCAAQGTWPERTVTFVVPFAAGGISDVLARMVAERLQTRLKQNFIVEKHGEKKNATPKASTR